MTSIVRVVASSDDVADELYGLAPQRFLAGRAARVAEARSAGDLVSAAAISRLRKPSVAAWVTNQLVRHCYDQVSELTQIGWRLRVATERQDGVKLRELCARRRRVEAELRRRALALAVEHGVRVDHRSLVAIGATFQAAMCRDDLARLLLAGRLSEALPRLSWPDLGCGFGEPWPARPLTADEPWPARPRSADEPLTRSPHDLGPRPSRSVDDAGDELARRRALRLARSSPGT